jgi:hypothetical protein
MTSYSSEQFYHDWRYAIAKDFTTPSGTPFPYAKYGKQEWGNEFRCFRFDRPPTTAGIHPDGMWMVVAVDEDLHLCNMMDSSWKMVLKGHSSQIDVLAFQPYSRSGSQLMATCAMGYAGGSVPVKPEIIVWGAETDYLKVCEPQLSSEDIASVSKHAVRAVVERLSDQDASLHLTVAEQDALTDAFKPAIDKVLASKNIDRHVKIHGRLQAGFQSNVFSPLGRYIIYLPGDAPQSNSDVAWDVAIWDSSIKRDAVVLVGHRDAIMWTGFNPDETLIGTVSWDKTMKIWDAGTGEVRFTFETSGQNWTGGFSANGRMFAGTCGDGSIHVYSLEDGTELFCSKFGSWCRALDWSPDSAFLAVGGQDCGKLILIDVGKKAIVQERLLSTSRSKVTKEEMRNMMGHFLEVCAVKFMDNGRKIAHLTTGDGSVELVDLEECCKWRFARDGTDSYPSGVADVEDTGREDEAVTKAASQINIWEHPALDPALGVLLATVDGDAVRVWSAPHNNFNREAGLSEDTWPVSIILGQ